MERHIQDLRAFRLPKDFRGRSAVFVQFWWLIQATLFRWSPQVLYGWRRWLLRRFGARIGRGVLIRPTVEITYPWKLEIGDWSWVGDHVTLYTLGEITIGAHAVISQHSYICSGSHDYQKESFDIYVRPVIIEDEVWLATGVFVAPGRRVGRGCVVSARSEVFSDLPEMMLCAGHPARCMRPRMRAKQNSAEQLKRDSHLPSVFDQPSDCHEDLS